MADMGALHTVTVEILMVAFLFLDSQVFQPVAVAHPKNLRCYHLRHSIRPFKSPDSSPLASDLASPSMPRRKSECLLPRNDRDHGRRHRSSRSLPLYGDTRLQGFHFSVDYQKDYNREQCVRRGTGYDNARNNDRKESNRRSSVGGHQECKTRSKSGR